MRDLLLDAIAVLIVVALLFALAGGVIWGVATSEPVRLAVAFMGGVAVVLWAWDRVFRRCRG